MKTWAAWMHSRTLSAALAAVMVFPMGTPSVCAAYTRTDGLRPLETTRQDDAIEDALNDATQNPSQHRKPPRGSVAGVFEYGFLNNEAALAGALAVDDIAAAVGRRPKTIAPDLAEHVKLGLAERPALGQVRYAGWLRATTPETRQQALKILERNYPKADKTKGNADQAQRELEALKQSAGRFDRPIDAALKAAELEANPNTFWVSVASANLGQYLGSPDILPDAVITAAKSVLEAAEQSGRIKDNTVVRNGDDLVVIVNHSLGHESKTAYAIALEALRAALTSAAAETPTGVREPANAIANLPADELAMALQVRPVEFPVKERASEPMHLVLTQNTAEGALNEKIWNFAVINPSQGRVEAVPGYRVQVADVQEQRVEARRRRDFTFDVVQGGGKASNSMYGIAAAPEGWAIRRVDPAEFEGRRAPDEPLLVVSGEQVGGGKARNTILISRGQSGYPAVGEDLGWFTDAGYVTGGENNEHLLPMRPMTLTEIAHRVPKDQAGFAIITWQSYQAGKFSPLVDAVAHSPHLMARRDTIDEEIYAPFETFPELQEFDPFTLVDAAQARAQWAQWEHEDRFVPLPDYANPNPDNVILHLMNRANNTSGGRTFSTFKIDVGGSPGHQEPPPEYLAALKASIREAKETGLLPDGTGYPIGDDIQLDGPHNQGTASPEVHGLSWYTFMRAAWVAKVLSRKPYGWAQDLPIFKQGKTDAELFRDVSAESKLTDRFIELLAEELRVIGREQEALGLSPDEREPVEQDLTIINEWYPRYKQGQLVYVKEKAGQLVVEDVKGVEGAVVFKGPPSGNVTGQGIGFAEIALSPETQDVTAWGLDKAGPGAFNWPVYWILYYWKHFEPYFGEYQQLVADAEAYVEAGGSSEKLPMRLQERFDALREALRPVEQRLQAMTDEDRLTEASDLPIVVELWDTRHHQAIFLDAQTERKTLRDFLVAENWFSPRRLWLRREGVAFNPKDPFASVDAIPLADFSTERLGEITGGQYIGKDDPKAVMVRRLGDRLAFLTNFYPYLLQGDERGSHNGDPIPGAVFSPVAHRRATPTVRSYPVQAMVHYHIGLNQGRGWREEHHWGVESGPSYRDRGRLERVVDVFDNPLFNGRRILSARVNTEVLRHNEFPPQGVSPGKAQRVPVLKKPVFETAEGGKTRAIIPLWTGRELVHEPLSEKRAEAVSYAIEAIAYLTSKAPKGIQVDEYLNSLDSEGTLIVEQGIAITGASKEQVKAVIDLLIGYHGKVEAAYPLATAVAKTVGKDSSYAVEQTVTIDDVAEGAKWIDQYDAVDHHASANAVRQAGKADTTNVVLINVDAFGEGPDLAQEIQEYLRRIARLYGVSVTQAAPRGATKLVLNVTTAEQADQAEARVAQLIEVQNENAGVELSRELFAGVIAGANASEVARQVQERFGAPVAFAVGSQPWLDQLAAVEGSRETMLRGVVNWSAEDAGTVTSPGGVFAAGIEALAAGRRVPEPIVGKLHISQEALTIVSEARPIEVKTEQSLRTYQRSARGV